MKKFIKVMLILAAVFFAAGLCFSGIRIRCRIRGF